MRPLVATLLLLWGLNDSARAERHPVLALSTEQDAALEKAFHDQAPAVELAVAVPLSDSGLRAPLEEAKVLYRDMSFGRCAEKLATAEERLIAERIPTPERVKTLAELLLWQGACLALQGGADAKEAPDRFVLARLLAPTLPLDPIFPPEVHKVFQSAKPGKPLPVSIKVQPPFARLWLDGKLQGAKASAALGLHYVVGERADRKVVARLIRILKSSQEIALNLAEPAKPEAAISLAAERLRQGPLERDEGLAVAQLLGRPLWTVLRGPAGWTASGYSTSTAAVPTLHKVEAASPEELVRAICAVEPACVAPVTSSPNVSPSNAPVAFKLSGGATPKAQKPITKRPWFWAVIGVAAGAVVAGVIAGAVVATQPRNYVLHFQ